MDIDSVSFYLSEPTIPRDFDLLPPVSFCPVEIEVFTACSLVRFGYNPGRVHCEAAKHVLHNLKRPKGWHYTLGGTPPQPRSPHSQMQTGKAVTRDRQLAHISSRKDVAWPPENPRGSLASPFHRRRPNIWPCQAENQGTGLDGKFCQGSRYGDNRGNMALAKNPVFHDNPIPFHPRPQLRAYT